MHIADIPVLTLPWGSVQDLTLVSPGRFMTGEPAYVLMQDGRVYCHVNVNLAGNPAAEGCFWVRDYSESQGLADALVLAGVLVLTGRVTGVGFGTAVEARMHDALVTP
jgi:hypothetical protein